jgi:hypothetical protein
MFGLSTVKLVGGLVAALILLSLVADRSRWMHRAHNAEMQNGLACIATRKASNIKVDCRQMPQQIEFLGEALNAVRAKTAKAQADDAAHAREVESRQTTIGQESSRDYQAELARVRADYAERLRRTASAANSGGRGNAPVSRPASSANGPDAASAQSELPSTDALTATEQALQLQAIQNWARKEGLAK